MKRAILITFLVALSLVLAYAAQEQTDDSVVVIYSGASFGKLKPCACSPESDMGGLLRRDTVLVDLRKQYPNSLLLDTGGLFEEPSTQNRLGAVALLNSLRALKYQAVGIGASDAIYGHEFLEQYGKDLLFVSNLRWKQANSPLHIPVKRFKHGQLDIEVFSLINPADVYLGSQSDFSVVDPVEFLNEQTQTGALTIVLCNTDQAAADSFLQHPGVEVVVNSIADANILYDPSFSFENGLVMTQAAIYGSRIGLLRLQWKDGLQQAENKFIPLDKHVPDGERVIGFFEKYEAQVKKLFLASLASGPAFDAEASPYSGSEACQSCHQEAFRIWQNSRHAHAWESLKKVNKNFDPECIACHVIGLGQEGGFVSEQDSPHLTDVGCESCHGPGKRHIAARRGELTPFTFVDCRRCHTAERSPAFKTRKYWTKIKH